MAILQKLANDMPADTGFRGTLALNPFHVGELLSRLGKPVEAEAECLEAIEIHQKLADEIPA
jgi:hypothetical protein